MRGPPGTETPQRTGAHSWRWGPTLEQCNTACGFLNCYMETESSAPQILKERAAARGEDGDSETPKYTFQRMETCLHERLKDKLGHGELLDMVLARSLLGSRNVLSLMGEEASEQQCSQLPQGWKPVNKNLFPSALVVGSHRLEAPRG